LLLDAPAPAQPRVPDVVELLREGGYVIAMRHASSPRTPPDASSADPDNVKRERELDAVGRTTASAMGDALRALDIPIGAVFTSPTFRARQTARYLGVQNAREVEELGDGGNSMAPDTEGARSAWLRRKAAEPPERGTNTLLVTHLPNLVGAFGDDVSDMADGEALILMPRGGRAASVARIKIDEWPEVAAR
jgi:phosphohistidine phosphatase SixA